MSEKKKLFFLLITLLIIFLLITSCVNTVEVKKATIKLSVEKPENNSDSNSMYTVLHKDNTEKTSESFEDIQITEVNLKVYDTDNKLVYEETNVSGDLYSFTFELNVGIYKFEVTAKSNERDIFYGTLEETILVGENSLTIKTKFFDGTLKLNLKIGQNYSEVYAIETGQLTIESSTAESSQTYILESSDFSLAGVEKIYPLYPGMWKMKMSVNYYNKNLVEDKHVLEEEFWIYIEPSLEKFLEIIVTESEIINSLVSLPYINKVDKLQVLCNKAENKLKVTWEYDLPTAEFQVFGKESNSLYELLGTTNSTNLELKINEKNYTAIGVNVILGDKESGIEEVSIPDLNYISPLNNATDVLINSLLRWEASVPESNQLTYDIYFGVSSTPDLVISNYSDTTYEPDLSYETTYYWKVVAKNGEGGITEGPVWSFTTKKYSVYYNKIIAAGSEGVFILDETNSSSPTKVGHYLTQGRVSSLSVKDNYAYVGNYDRGIVILDVSDPYNPINVGHINTGGIVREVFFKDNYAFVANDRSGLLILDVSDPKNSVQTSHLTLNRIYSVFAYGSYAYVCDYNDGLVIVDISDPENPLQVSQFDPSNGIGYLWRVTVVESYAFLVDNNSGLYILDVSNPENPVQLSYLELYDISDIEIKNQYAYVIIRGSGLKVIDISDPENPAIIGNINLRLSYTRDLFIKDNSAYITDDTAGLMKVDISDPENPYLVWQYDANRYYAYDVYVYQNKAFVADNFGELLIIDVSNPANPVQIGTTNQHLSPVAVQVKDNYAYLSSGGRLDVVDISNPTNPEKVGSFGIYGIAWGFFISDSYAYVPSYDYNSQTSYFYILDVSTPTQPIQTGKIEISDYIWDVFVENAYAYVAARNGLYVIDVSNPQLPNKVGNLELNYARGLYILDNFLYVANSSGVFIYDINDPASPSFIGQTWGFADDVFVIGNYAYVANLSMGISIWDISNKAAPTKLSEYQTNGMAYSIFVDGNYAYVADDYNGLVIFDVSDPYNPKLVSDMFWGTFVAACAYN